MNLTKVEVCSEGVVCVEDCIVEVNIRKNESTTRFTRCSLRYSETMIQALSSDRGFAVSLKTPESYTGELMTRGRLPQRKTPHMVPQPNMPEWRRQPRWKVDAVDFRQPSTETGASFLACSAAVPYTASRAGVSRCGPPLCHHFCQCCTGADFRTYDKSWTLWQDSNHTHTAPQTFTCVNRGGITAQLADSNRKPLEAKYISVVFR